MMVRSLCRTRASGAVSWNGLLALSLIVVLLVGCASVAKSSTYRYSAKWEGKAVTLTLVRNPELDQLANAAVQGQVIGFTSNDPLFACLANASLNVYVVDQQAFSGKYLVYGVCSASTTGGTTGVWTFPQPPAQTPSQYTYKATYCFDAQCTSLRIVQLTYIPGGHVPVGAPLVSQLTQLDTQDPQFACFKVVPIHVWNGQKAYPGRYVAYGGCPGGPKAAWTFTVTYTYNATYSVTTSDQTLSEIVPLKPVIAPARLPDTVLGEVTNFNTVDPSFACATGSALNYYPAPSELGSPLAGNELFLVYVVCPGSAAGFLTFQASITPYSYRAVWNGALTKLSLLQAPPGNAVPLKDQFVYSFTTDNPAFLCFNGSRLAVYKLQDDPKHLLAYDTCGVGITASWTFEVVPGTVAGS
ncbi:MAG TPA: hypothetical protein VGR57_01035 [Ktedonobacterales bacterium]|nr:hypothetical protein [Ktedonobacterales bacterium]